MHLIDSTDERNATTTANEMFRLILVLDLAEAKVLLTKITHPLSREQLDARQSGETEVAASVNYWEQFSNIFNSPETCVRNMCCTYLGDGPTAVKTSNMAPEPTGQDLTDIFEKCSDLDPSEFVLRDGPWCKKKVQEIKNFLYQYCRPNYGFFRSGNQDMENKYDEWTLFITRGGHPKWTYALMLTESGVSFLKQFADNGKHIDSAEGKDTSTLGTDLRQAEEDIADRKRRQNERQQKHRAKTYTAPGEEAEQQDEISISSSMSKLASIMGDIVSTPQSGSSQQPCATKEDFECDLALASQFTVCEDTAMKEEGYEMLRKMKRQRNL